jgi:hypothetical protein
MGQRGDFQRAHPALVGRSKRLQRPKNKFTPTNQLERTAAVAGLSPVARGKQSNWANRICNPGPIQASQRRPAAPTTWPASMATSSFQPTPVIEDGRTEFCWGTQCFLPRFNPRPPSKTGEPPRLRQLVSSVSVFQSTPVFEDGRTARLPPRRQGGASFNPRPSSKTGEPCCGWAILRR